MNSFGFLKYVSFKNFELNAESFYSLFSTNGDLDLRPADFRNRKRRLFPKKLARGDSETETVLRNRMRIFVLCENTSCKTTNSLRIFHRQFRNLGQNHF